MIHSRYQDDFDLASEAVTEASAIAMNYFRDTLKSWEKNPGDPVSEADIAIDKFLREKLAAARPDYGWLSEETIDDQSRVTAQRVWVVDPIDGTRAFIRGRTDFSVSVALVEKGAPVLGVVSSPANNAFYAAARGAGSTLNGQIISIDMRTELEDGTLPGDAGFYQSARHWPVPWPDLNFATCNSIALRIARVASGDYASMITVRAKSDWDIAAADIILQEAGGSCLDEDGRPLVYNQERARHENIIATTPALKQPILDRLQPALARWRAAKNQK